MRAVEYERVHFERVWKPAIARLIQAAWNDELVPENRVARVDVPEVDEEKKPRAVLTDSETGALVFHPKADP